MKEKYLVFLFNYAVTKSKQNKVHYELVQYYNSQPVVTAEISDN